VTLDIPLTDFVMRYRYKVLRISRREYNVVHSMLLFYDLMTSPVWISHKMIVSSSDEATVVQSAEMDIEFA